MYPARSAAATPSAVMASHCHAPGRPSQLSGPLADIRDSATASTANRFNSPAYALMPSEMSRNPTAATQDQRRLVSEIGIHVRVDRRVEWLEAGTSVGSVRLRALSHMPRWSTAAAPGWRKWRVDACAGLRWTRVASMDGSRFVWGEGNTTAILDRAPRNGIGAQLEKARV
jgi:hypothetical protein